MNQCKSPKCEFSLFRESCIKPNPYIERNSYCSRNNIPKNKCSYNFIEASKLACDYHKERLKEHKHKEHKHKEPKHKEHKDLFKELKDKEIEELLKKHKEIEKILKKPKDKDHKVLKGILKEPKLIDLKPKEKEVKISKLKEILKAFNEKQPKSKESNILKKKEKELIKVKNEINEILEKLGSTTISSSDKNDNISIEIFEQKLDKELEKLDEIIKKSPTTIKKSLVSLKIEQPIAKKNSSLISFLKKRTNINLSERIKFYHIIHKYIESIKYDVNCFSIYKDTDDESKKYKIGSKIILDRKIGDDSKYGITFISHFKSTSNSELEKYLIFATKLTDLSREGNLIEYQILEYLTILNIDEVCPNFPIAYGKLDCSKYKNREFDKKQELSLSYIEKKKRQILGSNLYDINQIYIFNELADGSLKQLKKAKKSNEIIINALEQCIISIIFFNKYINAYHNDCHYGNFLYHLISPGGFFHYNIYGIDYYIENIGYLWVIWDYGLIVPYYNSYDINKNRFGPFNYKILSITTDYSRFMHSIISIFNEQSSNLTSIILNHLLNYKYTTSIDNIKQFTIELLDILVTYSNTIKKHITNTDSIINKTPYIVI